MLRKRRRHRLEPYLKRLFGYAYSLTHDADKAEELVHDTAVKALAARRVPDEEAAYRAWLFTILRHAMIDHTRQPIQWDCALDAAELDEHAGRFHGSETEQVNALTVRLAFARLNLGQREILAAIDIAGLTYAEASRLFDVPVGTVMSRISRARSALYGHVEETAADPKLRILPLRKRSVR